MGINKDMGRFKQPLPYWAIPQDGESRILLDARAAEVGGVHRPVPAFAPQVRAKGKVPQVLPRISGDWPEPRLSTVIEQDKQSLSWIFRKF